VQFQADEYAVKLGYGDRLQSGLVKLQIENLGNMNPDKWFSTCEWTPLLKLTPKGQDGRLTVTVCRVPCTDHYSHPPLVERLTAINQLMKTKRE
jgi:STE24 endopeptidase